MFISNAISKYGLGTVFYLYHIFAAVITEFSLEDRWSPLHLPCLLLFTGGKISNLTSSPPHKSTIQKIVHKMIS